MAAIDKMYLKDYYIFDGFRRWCLIHKPSLLNNFYYWLMTEKEWDTWKEECYKNAKEANNRCHNYTDTIEHLRKHYKECGYDAPIDQLEEEVHEHLEMHELLRSKRKYIEQKDLPVTNFSFKQDKYLFWHCPISEVREYLHTHCGYKEKWYHKLLFKITFKED